MPYCTIDQVKARLSGKLELSESSKPTLAAVVAEITLVSSQVDVALAMGDVALPIAATETALLEDLARLTSREVAYQAKGPMAGTALDKDNNPLFVEWHKAFDAALALMRAGEYTSVGVSDDAGPESHTMNAEEDEEDPSLDPVITRGMKF